MNVLLFAILIEIVETTAFPKLCELRVIVAVVCDHVRLLSVQSHSLLPLLTEHKWSRYSRKCGHE